ncbi:Inositol phospholipid synthesis protein Scs3p [Coniochaeta hoffmannii]|uniref:Acyl-coenzyme A diphosphatase SCS3 n=1 Tax=Coniochaeta hoffmannii TaxID=91930 RepID=A0AA38VHA7_9PEZI|nr:Inositol phospholipid synthesis protein Scs3p [Coniochaeta hoffmannii]
MDSPAYNLRSRPSQMAASPSPAANGHAPQPSSSSSSSSSTSTATPSKNRTRNSPYLPTPTEILLLSAYPALLLFGAAFSAISPQTRAAPFFPGTHAHSQLPGESPSYFARKDNLLNTLFVKRGWAWFTVAFAVWVLTHPGIANARARARAAARWGVVTGFWFLTTQWCFGPPLIDRGFRWSGGRCEVVENKVEEGEAGVGDVFTAAACKTVGGRWSGGTDISGHVFMLVLGSAFLMQEVGWVVLRWRGRRELEERSVVMHDGAIKGAGVEADADGVEVGNVVDALGLGGRVAMGVVVLSWWMVLMTAIYFHTWFEKLTGLLVALLALYTTYILPRWIPAWRNIVGLPGI